MSAKSLHFLKKKTQFVISEDQEKCFTFAQKLKLTIAIIERKEKAEKTARHMYFSLAFIVWSTQKGVGKI